LTPLYVLIICHKQTVLRLRRNLVMDDQHKMSSKDKCMSVNNSVTVERHLSGLTGANSHPDRQKIKYSLIFIWK
jgi:hypothetical protein